MTALTKIIAIFAVGTGLMLLLIFFLASPLMKEVTAINASVKAKKTELSILEQQIKAFKTAQLDLAKATRKQDILNAIPVKEDLVLSVLDIESAAKLTNGEQTLKIKELAEVKESKRQQQATSATPGASVLSKKSGVGEVEYELNIASNDFTSMVNFLSYVEHLPHFTELSKFSLSSERLTGSDQDTAGRTGKVFGDFQGAFFIRPVK
ncbi:MAG: hypothetical protein KW802_04615 [Candidatus Doudnabacteria bacterium]|nr:hypothetical protein [Candidatus Doudnabacteria bacterium]